MDIEPIKITGLDEFRRNLRALNTNLPKGLRLAGNQAAQLVVDWAQPKVPSDRGRARKSLRAASTQNKSRVLGGGKRAPYFAFLDFGGRVGRKRSVRRHYVADGRYIFPGYRATKEDVNRVLVAALIGVAESADLDVTSG